MHRLPVLHTSLNSSVPSLHKRRRQALVAVVTSLVGGAQASVTSMGRGLSGRVRDKHKIKRTDRLLSDRTLYQEHQPIYSALTQCLTQHLKEPVILIDGSPLCTDQSWQLLRAAVSVGGRALTLYEEVHPRRLLSNRRIQHQFLATLAGMMKGCRPIVIVLVASRTVRFYSTSIVRFCLPPISPEAVGRWADRGRCLGSGVNPSTPSFYICRV